MRCVSSLHHQKTRQEKRGVDDIPQFTPQSYPIRLACRINPGYRTQPRLILTTHQTSTPPENDDRLHPYTLLPIPPSLPLTPFSLPTPLNLSLITNQSSKMDTTTLFSVRNKTVLITGGAKGLGYMITTGFVLAGARVYISSRDAKACETAARELNALAASSSSSSTSIPGGSCTALPADLSKASECARLASDLASREKCLHVLINNSGATWGESYDSYPDSAWSKLLTLNLQRVFTLTQALTPLLEKAGEESRVNGTVTDPGRVIHIGSIDGIRTPTMPTFAYSASKAGLHALSKHLATHLGPRGITSNTLACGPFPSKMMKATLEEFGEEIKEANPLGRIGTPEDAAGACLFLASRAGAFVNGATIRLDGGVSLMSRI